MLISEGGRSRHRQVPRRRGEKKICFTRLRTLFFFLSAVKICREDLSLFKSASLSVYGVTFVRGVEYRRTFWLVFTARNSEYDHILRHAEGSYHHARSKKRKMTGLNRKLIYDNEKASQTGPPISGFMQWMLHYVKSICGPPHTLLPPAKGDPSSVDI